MNTDYFEINVNSDGVISHVYIFVATRRNQEDYIIINKTEYDYFCNDGLV